ncbi:hypothetical protein Q0812_06425 [Brevundimonas sp. 2R-24]|uniref:Hemerythrin-like domain-containing protein n=1 Tax=Peiella sedimenti TaxID=3061083 RepID=A0ABT8SKH0_9CAUL|nr:hypothetical protein [Caulobacteraceae bacterium XZ-24]
MSAAVVSSRPRSRLGLALPLLGAAAAIAGVVAARLPGSQGRAADALLGDWREQLVADHLHLAERLEAALHTSGSLPTLFARRKARLLEALEAYLGREAAILGPRLGRLNPPTAEALEADRQALAAAAGAIRAAEGDEARARLRALVPLLDGHASLVEDEAVPALLAGLDEDQRHALSRGFRLAKKRLG